MMDHNIVTLKNLVLTDAFKLLTRALLVHTSNSGLQEYPLEVIAFSHIQL